MGSFARIASSTFVLLLLSLYSVKADAFLTTGLDFTFAGQGFFGGSLKSRVDVMINLDSLGVGPVVYFDHPHSGFVEGVAGAGVRFGKSTFISIEGGYLFQNASGISSSGFAAGFVLGWNASQYFRLSVPILFKYLTINGASLMTFQYVPYLGVKISI